MPSTTISIAVDLRTQPVRDGYQVDNCLAMDVTMRLLGGPSRLNISSTMLEHFAWIVQRTVDFQLWQFLHPITDLLPQPSRALSRWALVRSFISLKRRIHTNKYVLREAIAM